MARSLGRALALIALLGAPAALAQGAPATPAPATAPDPAYEAARAAFESLPEADRKGIQDALVWTGDFNGVTSGAFGRRTYDAIVAYQKRTKAPASGLLDARGRTALQGAAQKARDALGFALVDDPRTGARLGLPRKILVKADQAPGQGGGTRWQSADDKITLDTRTYPPEETLPALFERLSNLQVPGRQVTYKLLRPDYFVITGETQGGKFYIRYGAGPSGLRGYTLGYDKSLAKDFDRTVIAIANSFAAYPLDAAPGAATAATAAPAAPPARPSPPPSPALAATGVVVAPRRVLTSAEAGRCQEVRAGSARARVVKTEGALALLEAEGDLRAAPPPLRAFGAEDVVVLAHVSLNGPAQLSAAPAAASASGILGPLQPGATGAPAFDRTGALTGIVGAMPSAPRLIAGVAPPMNHPYTGAPAVAAFLQGAGVTPAAAPEAQARTVGELAAALGPAVVAVSCAR